MTRYYLVLWELETVFFNVLFNSARWGTKQAKENYSFILNLKSFVWLLQSSKLVVIKWVRFHHQLPRDWSRRGPGEPHCQNRRFNWKDHSSSIEYSAIDLPVPVYELRETLMFQRWSPQSILSHHGKSLAFLINKLQQLIKYFASTSTVHIWNRNPLVFGSR